MVEQLREGLALRKEQVERQHQMLIFLRLKQVMARTGLSRSTIYEKISSGEFPAPISLSENGRAVAWLDSALTSWQLQRIAASRPAFPATQG